VTFLLRNFVVLPPLGLTDRCRAIERSICGSDLYRDEDEWPVLLRLGSALPKVVCLITIDGTKLFEFLKCGRDMFPTVRGETGEFGRRGREVVQQ
jgi:hypothetical protein